MRGLALFVALTFGSACSFALVSSPPTRPPPPGEPVRCTKDLAAPLIDTMVATLLVLLVHNFATSFKIHDSECESCDDETTASDHVEGIGLGLVLSSPWIFSAVYGFAATSGCRDLHDRVEPPPRRSAAVRRDRGVLPQGPPGDGE